jgi:ketosteroid isomerase-like protein
MSRYNVEFVREFNRRVNDEGYEAALPVIAPEFEFFTPADMAAEPDTYRGPEGIRRWFETFYDAMDEVRIVAERYIDAGEEWVVVPSKLVTRGRHSGLVAEQPVVLAWAIRDRKAVGLRLFATEEEAFESIDADPSTR